MAARRTVGCAAPVGDDAAVGALVADRDLGPQLVEADSRLARSAACAAGQSSRKAGRRAGRAQDEEVEQDLALRRQQRGVARLARRQGLDVVGQQPLQEARRVLAVDANDAAVGEKGGGRTHRKASQAACHGAAC